MTFLSAASFFWLIPVLGTIIVLYLMKMRRLDMRVPATFLWPQMTSDVRANAPFQKLRFSILLLLQLLAAALLIFALTGPMRKVHGLAGSATVIVLDNSASMAATDVSPSRFGEAVRRVSNLIGGMRPGDRLALIDAGASMRIVFPLTSDKAQMQRAIAGLSPSDAPTDIGEGLRLAAALVAGRTKGRILVLSDGCFAPVTDFAPGKAELQYEQIGTSYKNAAITAFNSSLTPAGVLQCFASIRNFDSSPLPVTVTFKIDGQVANARVMTIPAGQAMAATVDAPRGASKADVEISTPGDILASDNHATLFLKSAGTVRTLLVSNGNLFLERALSLNPAIKLALAASLPEGERFGTPGASGYDLVVFDNIPPTPVKSSAIWSFGYPGSQLGVADNGIAAHPSVVDWSRDDPVTQYGDFRGMQIDRAHIVRTLPGAGARAVVTGSGGPLVVTSHAAGRRTIYTAFNILDSDFPLRVSFPVFITNGIDWLTSNEQRESGAGSGIMAAPGRPFTVAVPEGSATLVRPDGGHERVAAPSGIATIRNLDKVGVYRLTGSNTKVAIAVNILDEQSSDIRPRPTLNLSGARVAGTKSQSISLAEIWRPILLGVLVVMSLEWWVFVRRS
ncbi:MAG TPA: VWA domain-containing protein [Capsulimonadaceae bacterium]